MTLELPVWAQALEYSARIDRGFIDEVMRRQNRVFRGLVAAQTGSGDASVTVSPGTAAIRCTSQQYGGMWFVRSTADEVVAAPVRPPTGTRTDTLIAVVNDPNAGGAPGDNWELQIIQGTTLPDNAIALAQLARTSTETGILTSSITDVAPRGEWAWTVSSSPPTGRGIPGDLWVVCA